LIRAGVEDGERNLSAVNPDKGRSQNWLRPSKKTIGVTKLSSRRALKKKRNPLVGSGSQKTHFREKPERACAQRRKRVSTRGGAGTGSPSNPQPVSFSLPGTKKSKANHGGRNGKSAPGGKKLRKNGERGPTLNVGNAVFRSDRN